MREELPKVESPLKVNAPQLVLTGIAKFALDEEANEAAGPLVGKTLFLHPSPPHGLDEIRLSANQRKLIELLEGGKRIDELAAETTIPFNEIMRLFVCSGVIGIVVPEERLPKEAPPEAAAEMTGADTIEFPIVELEPAAGPPPAAPAPAPAPPAAPQPAAPQPAAPAPAGPEAVSEKERDALMEAFLKHRNQDAFDLLGVAENVSITDVEQKYLEFSRRYAPWKFDLPETRSLVEKTEDLFLAGGRAFGELCDRERRNALIVRRRNLRSQKAKKPARDRFLIKSELLDSETQFKKGHALMQAGKYREALQQLEFACDCDPQNSTYRAEVAYCRFLAASGSKQVAAAEESLEDLHEALRIDPKCGLAVFYAGVLQGKAGLFAEAEKNLRRSIRMLMPDRRPIQALKELQAKQKKKKRRLF